MRWHQVLVYALTGERRPELGQQRVADLDVVVAALQGRRTGAHAVPADLRSGIGAAQLAAVLAELRSRLAQEAGGQPVVRDRVLSADERRLTEDAPPHHL